MCIFKRHSCWFTRYLLYQTFQNQNYISKNLQKHIHIYRIKQKIKIYKTKNNYKYKELAEIIPL